MDTAHRFRPPSLMSRKKKLTLFYMCRMHRLGKRYFEERDLPKLHCGSLRSMVADYGVIGGCGRYGYWVTRRGREWAERHMNA